MNGVRVVIKVIEMEDDKPGKEHALAFWHKQGDEEKSFYVNIKGLVLSAINKAKDLRVLKKEIWE